MTNEVVVRNEYDLDYGTRNRVDRWTVGDVVVNYDPSVTTSQT